MASSRASSPASSGGTPEPLTPHSKIRALLATVESSEEEDGEALRKTDGASPTRTNTNANVVTQNNTEQQTRHDDGLDESDVAIRPRGKLASRMQGATKEPEITAAVPESTRERVKKMLAREEAEAEVEQTRDGEMADMEDEDDGLPVAPRRLQRRTPREPARSPSPGLFVFSPTRPSPAKSVDTNPQSDNDLPAIKSDRFKALVERKRQERLAREAAEEARKAEQRARQEKFASELEQFESDDGNDSGITDDQSGRRLTQQARPTRKASKKAVEEMNRETQRMARNMQLAHEARTRKKISTASLFERFNYKPATGLAPDPKTHSSSRPTTPQTDAEMKDADTPPSSPPTTKGQDLPPAVHNADSAMGEDDDAELPSSSDVMNTAAQRLDKGKGKASAIDLDKINKAVQKPKRRVRVRLPAVAANMATLDSDDELEVTRPTKGKISAIFDNIPAQQGKESRSLKVLQALALVKSPGEDNRRKNDHSRMTAGELHAQLYQRAKQQAKVERDRRLEMLKAQGIVVQTADERERQEQEVEDLVAKAREEAQQIMQLERAATKKARRESGEADPLAWDDSDNEEYEDSANEADVEASAIKLSGSEDDDDVEGDDVEEGISNSLVDEDAESGVSEVDEAQEEDEDAVELPVVKQRRAWKYTAVLSDDEAEVQATPRPIRTATQMTPAAPKTISPAAPTSVLRSSKKTFIPGLPVYGPAGLGLTQIFAGTMDDSQMSSSCGPTQSMMPDFDHFPDSNFSASMDEPAEDMVMDSQREETQNATQGIQLNLSQSQMHGLDSLLPDVFQTQMSQMIEPSQDAGLQQHTPLRERFNEPPFSTVETLAADQEDDVPHESPLVRRGRLRRKMQMPMVEEEPIEASTKATPSADNAFNVMADGVRKEKRKRLIDEFDRKKTKAKEMIEEQADESEDEYAGLGGADGEDSDNESTASLKEIIDDVAGNDVDGGKLAAFYADRERANDEKEVEKLFKDITTGMLRRKRGADYDLSDSDDGGEARQRMKRRQFAKMQKALFSDERVKKMAEDPGNQAFLRTIEDRGSEDEMDVLDVMATQEPAESQLQSQDDGDAAQRRQEQTIPDSQAVKQPLGVSGENRAPAHMRRTKGAQKPSNIGQVRETLSDLLEERQGSVIPATEAGSESDEEDGHPASPRSDKENQAPKPRRGNTAVVDRISLKRNASTASNSSARLAFAAAAQTAGSSSFKVPALLRRATTNSTLMSDSSTSSGGVAATAGAVGSTGEFGEDAKIKKGAGKRSGVGGFAREGEVRVKMRDSERRREEKKAKGAARRVGVVGGLLGKGSFE
ncbi:Mediator of replication checkpoint protein 1 [Tolypocladium ophioglossoides CBS 100239]|uniref:Mediator of replication checkpoint protein 1 n=1 Tax=Tolypocladium ophioglossoides (strain CBS 100239) TaxID=1163406 RepID=A0A0L0N6W6_TOLOC|nr:Mediator of replication checkpoint protein 1 [Tolypocladium ophioglossoides CBS 100239]